MPTAGATYPDQARRRLGSVAMKDDQPLAIVARRCSKGASALEPALAPNRGCAIIVGQGGLVHFGR